ncbi:hypothetical protein M3936_23505 [Sutcliffiella horikoshii]|uniref:hypothetical protein n=1 Tax=Sutcliffiella horikoshii TaxID=79883 RepID=UPI0007D05D9F|nr:hypothetical protein [Sutcliffiella horikoshii]MCM3620525.1 hypothetical protein [Sutcliffiella horikoshii]
MQKLLKTNLYLIIFILFMVVSTANAQNNTDKPWSKYPDNSQLKLEDVDSFYQGLDKKLYREYPNAKLNIREKTTFKEINKVKYRADKYQKSRESGNGVHPNRQVYVFISVSQKGDMKTAVFDAEKRQIMSFTGPLEKANE